MPDRNKRVELEMQILKYRQLLTRVNDDEFLKRAEEKIAELEQQLQPPTAD
jgi:hypothetical protein